MIEARKVDTALHRRHCTTVELIDRPAWRYEQMQPGGVNDPSVRYARTYDERHQAFGNYGRQAEEILAFLGADGQRTALDMGRGTGAYALHAARYYRNIPAGDISQAMLKCTRRKAGSARLTNIALHRDGFLTCDHNREDEPVGAIVSVAALHHPPDFWKLVGLRRLASMLKPDGGFYLLLDAVFSFDIALYESPLRQFAESSSNQARPAARVESQTRLRDEYRICQPIIEGLLGRTGLQRGTADVADEFLAVYSCATGVAHKSPVGLDV